MHSQGRFEEGTSFPHAYEEQLRGPQLQRLRLLGAEGSIRRSQGNLSITQIALWKELNIINCFTLEVSFCGSDFGKYEFYHFNVNIYR